MHDLQLHLMRHHQSLPDALCHTYVYGSKWGDDHRSDCRYDFTDGCMAMKRIERVLATNA
jgi:hypothetical protein